MGKTEHIFKKTYDQCRINLVSNFETNYCSYFGDNFQLTNTMGKVYIGVYLRKKRFKIDFSGLDQSKSIEPTFCVFLLLMVLQNAFKYGYTIPLFVFLIPPLQELKIFSNGGRFLVIYVFKWM